MTPSYVAASAACRTSLFSCCFIHEWTPRTNPATTCYHFLGTARLKLRSNLSHLAGGIGARGLSGLTAISNSSVYRELLGLAKEPHRYPAVKMLARKPSQTRTRLRVPNRWESQDSRAPQQQHQPPNAHFVEILIHKKTRQWQLQIWPISEIHKSQNPYWGASPKAEEPKQSIRSAELSPRK